MKKKIYYFEKMYQVNLIVVSTSIKFAFPGAS